MATNFVGEIDLRYTRFYLSKRAYTRSRREARSATAALCWGRQKWMQENQVTDQLTVRDGEEDCQARWARVRLCLASS